MIRKYIKDLAGAIALRTNSSLVRKYAIKIYSRLMTDEEVYRAFSSMFQSINRDGAIKFSDVLHDQHGITARGSREKN